MKSYLWTALAVAIGITAAPSFAATNKMIVPKLRAGSFTPHVENPKPAPAAPLNRGTFNCDSYGAPKGEWGWKDTTLPSGKLAKRDVCTGLLRPR